MAQDEQRIHRDVAGLVKIVSVVSVDAGCNSMLKVKTPK